MSQRGGDRYVDALERNERFYQTHAKHKDGTCERGPACLSKKTPMPTQDAYMNQFRRKLDKIEKKA